LERLYEFSINAVAYLAVAVVAGVALVPLLRGGAWLPPRRLRRGVWSGGEVFLLFLIYLVVPSALVLFLAEAFFFHAVLGLFQDDVPNDLGLLRQFNLGEVLAVPLVFALHLTVLYGVSRTFPRHIGLSPSRWRPNVRLGIVGFLMATPAVLLLYFFTLLFTFRSEHVLEELSRQSLTAAEWVILGLRVVLLAPLLEEWLFRGLLQGWLRRASLIGHFLLAALALCLGAQPTLASLRRYLEGETEAVFWEPLAFTVVMVSVYAAGIVRIWRPVLREGWAVLVDQQSTAPAAPSFQSGQPRETDSGTAAAHNHPEGITEFKPRPTAVANEAAEDEPPALPLPALHGPRWEKFQYDNARWAIVGSAMMFAVFHNVWPSQIAIFLLGLVLGWLAYRTQNLLPGIVLHALFNLVACLVLIYSVSTGASGNDAATALRPASGGATANSVPGS
jgi:membrane protease YdiL (CAAX protease family)